MDTKQAMVSPSNEQANLEASLKRQKLDNSQQQQQNLPNLACLNNMTKIGNSTALNNA